MKIFKLLILFNLLTISILHAQSPNFEIWEIQGAGVFSPQLNNTVSSAQNVVTAVGDDFFFIQTPSYRSDNNPATSDGIKINTNNTPTVEVGNLVSISGTVRESFQRTQISEDDGLTITVDSTVVALPNPVILTVDFPSSEILAVPDLEKVEGMLVQFPQAITTSPANEFGETGIKVGTQRSFREAGIESPAPNGLPEWDGNPEVFEIKLRGLGLPDEPLLSARRNISATGVMDFSFGDFLLLPTVYEISGPPPFRGVDAVENTQATIGSFNCLGLSNLDNEYSVRRQKVANYIVDLMQAPDVLALQEVRSLFVLEDIADLIKAQHPEIEYTAYLIPKSTSGSFVINNGYLVKNTMTDVVVTWLGAEEQFSFGGDLHRRPPLLLEANFNTNPPKPISVLNLHLKSLNGITGGNATSTRRRRHEEAVSVARMVEARSDENLVVVGDFNAFQFSDGYVDIVNQIAGTPSLGAETPVENIVTVPLTNQSLTLPPDEQYSYIFQGNAQILDHCLTSEFDGFTFEKLQYVRANADQSEEYKDILAPLYYTSDHDGFVMFLEMGTEISTNLKNLRVNNLGVSYPNPYFENAPITFNLEAADVLNLQVTNVEGKVVFEKNLGQLAQGEHFVTMPLQISDGMYFLQIKGSENHFAGKVFFGK